MRNEPAMAVTVKQSHPVSQLFSHTEPPPVQSVSQTQCAFFFCQSRIIPADIFSSVHFSLTILVFVWHRIRTNVSTLLSLLQYVLVSEMMTSCPKVVYFVCCCLSGFVFSGGYQIQKDPAPSLQLSKFAN